MGKSVRYTIAVKRASVGTLALQVYQMSKALARKTMRQVIMPHLDNMKRALGRTRAKPVVEPILEPLAPKKAA